MTKRDKVESVAQQIHAAFDDLSRLECPACGNKTLHADSVGRSVGVMCQNPIRIDTDTSEWVYCDFSIVIAGVDIAAGPFVLKFAEERPMKPPVRTKQTRAPRTKAVRKIKPR